MSLTAAVARREEEAEEAEEAEAEAEEAEEAATRQVVSTLWEECGESDWREPRKEAEQALW